MRRITKASMMNELTALRAMEKATRPAPDAQMQYRLLRASLVARNNARREMAKRGIPIHYPRSFDFPLEGEMVTVHLS